MTKNSILIGVLMEDSETISYTEVCNKYNMPEKLLAEMMEYGLFSNKSAQIEQLKLNQSELQRIESAFRLHRDLGINLPGIALALELLDKIEKMETELHILHKHF